MTPIRSFMLMAALAFSNVEALAGCQNSVYNETVAYFNSAPVTFSFEIATATECQNWCRNVKACQAWLYVDQSGQCDLHRTKALSLSDNIGFTFGGCEPNPESRLPPSPTASPTASSSAAASKNQIPSESATLPRARREIFRHRHEHHH
ncbi:uncharacterized protein BO95DRAFT_518897 [Aspergillus brunneoviolaceus CBS 621.78]|uniref:Uncharacterized protein n=1 Tax=Aspergillus brunneoviolaceus CBS 621.78 TaxID=1450534 RepID=A0ACD1FTB3_9EURO|nr:hypothetical protein BO95DRAFT_518897 [Aspergillus brunneoviolaceus CBS 621.78]RAH40199.1 hypothetical protein BO95DRAFT_518897 [Aspergillus brunneoviolaceus CBS 621.78]